MGHLAVNTKLDNTFINAEKKLTYPFIFLPKYGDELPVVIRCLLPGAIPIVLENKGSLLQIGTCTLSAIEFRKLLNVYNFEVVLSQTDRRTIMSTEEVLEVMPWMVSS